MQYLYLLTHDQNFSSNIPMTFLSCGCTDYSFGARKCTEEVSDVKAVIWLTVQKRSTFLFSNTVTTALSENASDKWHGHSGSWALLLVITNKQCILHMSKVTLEITFESLEAIDS